MDKKLPDEEMTDLMELDDGSSKSVLSPSVGENGSHSPVDSNGAIETDTDDDLEMDIRPTPNAKTQSSQVAETGPESHANGFGTQSEGETDVADNNVTSNLESSNQRCSLLSSPSSSRHEMECDPIDTLKG